MNTKVTDSVANSGTVESQRLAAPVAGWLIKPGATNIIDLSYPMSPDLTQADVYPVISFEIFKGRTPEVNPEGYPVMGLYARVVNNMLEGHGTHIEASSHAFGVRGRNIDEYPLYRFIGPGVIIDVTAKAEVDRDYKVTVDDLLGWEEKHGRIPDSAILVLKTGWGKYWGDKKEYFGIDDKGEWHFPGMSIDACQWLADNRTVSAIGTDCAMVDGGQRVKTARPRFDAPVRDISQCPPKDVMMIEYMANVDKLPESGSLIICAPINFVGGYAGVVRCLAVLP